MTDIMSPQARKRVMSRIRGKNTTPERYLCLLLQASGLNFTQHDKSLPGTPDFVLQRDKIAIFVDGDFWHGWRFPIWRHKLSLPWRQKIDTNRFRDRKNHRALRNGGWKVVRLWEHQIETDILNCVRRVIQSVGQNDSVDWGKIKNCLSQLPRLKRRDRLPKP